MDTGKKALALFDKATKKKTPFDPNDEEYPDNKFPKVLVTGEETIEKMFVKTQCINCHVIPGISWARKTVGPKLTRNANAHMRLKDPKYSGSATTVKEYIRESILYPKAKVVAGYQPAMPSYKGQLSEDDLNSIVEYLKSISDFTPKETTAKPAAGEQPAESEANE